MFKKLSSALVAISLVAVAQPALGRDMKCLAVASKTDHSVSGRKGNTWTYASGAEVTVEGKEADKTQVQVGMHCSIIGARSSTNINDGTIDSISCTKKPLLQSPCEANREAKGQ